MLKRLVNSARISFTITPVDPLLIKSGQATVGGVDMSFVRTRRNDGKDEPFIPGSSLKGVIRSYSEKICRSLRPNGPVPVCLPYVAPGKEKPGEECQASCGLRLEAKKDRLPTTDSYHYSCPACRLFGSHVFTGRYKSSDAYLTHPGKFIPEVRDGVAIDRLTGGAVPGAKYDLEVLVSGEFSTSIEIQNFERWQLGLVSLTLRDMEEELIRLGSGASRGLGRVRAKVTSFVLDYYGTAPNGFVGLAALCNSKERQDYGLFSERAGAGPLPAMERRGIRHCCDITAAWKEILAPAVDDLTAYVGGVAWPTALDVYLKKGDTP